jgi:hypothetical protein
MEKRGELTSSQIIMLVLAIAGFVIIVIFLLLFLDLETQTDEELCRLSILTRATTPDLAQRAVPLKCTTSKICITTGEGDCSSSFLGEDNIVKVKLPNDVEQAAKMISEISANTLYDCWSMTGQGKLDLFGEAVSLSAIENLKGFLNLEAAQPHCIICSRVALSSGLQKRDDILSKVNVNEYLETQQVPGSRLTYLQTFTDQQVNSFPGDARDVFSDPKNQKQGTTQVANVFTQIKTKTDPQDAAYEGAIGAGTFILGGSYAFGALGNVVQGVVSHPVIAGVIGLVAVGGTAGLRGYGASRDQEVSIAYCGEFTSSDKENKHGCSFTMPVDYNDIEKINKLCAGGIEGSP